MATILIRKYCSVNFEGRIDGLQNSFVVQPTLPLLIGKLVLDNPEAFRSGIDIKLDRSHTDTVEYLERMRGFRTSWAVRLGQLV